MKRSKKVTIGIIIFFVIVATVIGGRTAIVNPKYHITVGGKSLIEPLQVTVVLKPKKARSY